MKSACESGAIGSAPVAALSLESGIVADGALLTPEIVEACSEAGGITGACFKFLRTCMSASLVATNHECLLELLISGHKLNICLVTTDISTVTMFN